MKTMKIASVVVGCAVLMTGCFSPTATGLKEEDIHFVQFDEVKAGQEVAVIDTTLGKITMALFPDEAPNTVAYFKKLVNDGFYNDRPIFTQTSERRFITGATDENCQEGAIETDDGKPVDCEITPSLWHFSGAVSVQGFEKSRLTREMQSDSRFFIVGDVDANTETVKQMEEFNYPDKVVNAYKEHGGLPLYTGSFTVFGQVIQGMDVVNAILKIQVDENQHPKDGTKINSIQLVAYEPSAVSGSAGTASGDTGSSSEESVPVTSSEILTESSDVEPAA